MRFLRDFLVISLSILIGFPQGLASEENKTKKLNLNELALPSEVKNISKKSGSIYYSPSVKQKVLIPVHFWGEINSNGLHFIPEQTKFLNGLSLAGGPTSAAKLEEVYITRKTGDKSQRFTFDLTSGGNAKAHDFVYKPGDMVFIKKDQYLENRAYYTSLISVITTLLTGILLYNQVKDV